MGFGLSDKRHGVGDWRADCAVAMDGQPLWQNQCVGRSWVLFNAYLSFKLF